MRQVNLATIGFTKTTAERFFERLVHAGVKKVMDVRLHNTSQLSGFAKADAASFTSFNFNFGGVMDFLRAAGEANPMLKINLIDPLLQQQGEQIEKVCAALGPRVYGTVKLVRPFTLDSQRMLWAIRSDAHVTPVPRWALPRSSDAGRRSAECPSPAG